MSSESQFEVLFDHLPRVSFFVKNRAFQIVSANRRFWERLTCTFLYGSNLGNASSHNWRNLPILVAGSGYRHGSYVAHDEEDNTPLANLFVTFAQRTGLEIG